MLTDLACLFRGEAEPTHAFRSARERELSDAIKSLRDSEEIEDLNFWAALPVRLQGPVHTSRATTDLFDTDYLKHVGAVRLIYEALHKRWNKDVQFVDLTLFGSPEVVSRCLPDHPYNTDLPLHCFYTKSEIERIVGRLEVSFLYMHFVKTRSDDAETWQTNQELGDPYSFMDNHVGTFQATGTETRVYIGSPLLTREGPLLLDRELWNLKEEGIDYELF
jgi:hypothetical protein